KCPILYHDDKVKDEDYFKNVISCADYQLGSFINWLKTQNFYNNTLIVIVGDHLAMNDALFEKISKRKVFDVYINGLNRDINETRLFSALDTMPTVLEGLGYKINGHRLGLGTSLYSDEKTLLEKGFTAEKLGKELDKSSEIYNHLLFGK
ncbi:MAG: sulfatase-like hydrolase/transferase, partial [Alphaproteobacteria bacterium]|nr:sulfatase-like hydrolase/transferase [Alphaproteobacteria bacterium]